MFVFKLNKKDKELIGLISIQRNKKLKPISVNKSTTDDLVVSQHTKTTAIKRAQIDMQTVSTPMCLKNPSDFNKKAKWSTENLKKQFKITRSP